MRKRRFDFHPAPQWRADDTQSITELIAWYNAAHAAHLRVIFWLEADQLAELEQIVWAIMRIRMEKDRQRCDPNFHIVTAAVLSPGSTDLVAGLDNRLPRLTVSPYGFTSEALADPQGFLKPFELMRKGRILDMQPLFHSRRPEADIRPFIDALQKADRRRGSLLAQTPSIEVPFDARVDSGETLCGLVAQLWEAFPDLTRTLGLFGDGYVKHFYQLKELWYLSQLTGSAIGETDLAPLHAEAQAAGANMSILGAFETHFLEHYASLENYARWRTQSKSVVLEFDLDSIADTHECQSPVFLDGRWILDRDSLFHDKSSPDTTKTTTHSTGEQHA